MFSLHLKILFWASNGRVGSCKWQGVHGLMRRPLSQLLSKIWTSLNSGRQGDHHHQHHNTRATLHLLHWWLDQIDFPSTSDICSFQDLNITTLWLGAATTAPAHTHQKGCPTFDTIGLISRCWYLRKCHALPLLWLLTIFDRCRISTDTDQTKLQRSSSGSREQGTTHILTGGRTQFPALYCCTSISQTRVLLWSCELFAFSKSLIA